MERHDPLCQLLPAVSAPQSPAQSPPKRRSRKGPALLRLIAEVKDETLAFLYGGPRQEKDDYQRNLARAEQIRREFVGFCEANLHFTDWRRAWAAFLAREQRSTRMAKEMSRAKSPQPNPAPVPAPRPVFPKSVIPLWRQRMQRHTLSCAN